MRKERKFGNKRNRKNIKERAARISAIALGILLLFSSIAAAQSSSVILVSDNEADSAIANLIASYLGFRVVITPWGEFNQSVVDEIAALAPENVYIFGGEVAVVGEYDTALNFTNVTRIAGETREITAARAMKHFKGKLKGKKIIAIYGYDSDAIKKAFERAKKEKAIIAFIRPEGIPDELKEAINETNASEVEIEEPPNLIKLEWLKDMVEIVPKDASRKFKIKELNETEKAEKAWKQIEEAQEKINKAENKINELNITNEELLSLLNNSKEHLQKAIEAYNNSKYGEAFGLAVSAEHIAENAKKIAERISEAEEDVDEMMHKLSEMEREISEELDEKMKEAEKEGIAFNTTRMQLATEMIREAREALERGDLATAMMKMMEARKHKAMVKIEIEKEKEKHEKKMLRLGVEQEKDHRKEMKHMETNETAHEGEMKHEGEMSGEGEDMHEGMG